MSDNGYVTKFPHGCHCTMCDNGCVDLIRHNRLLYCHECIEDVRRYEMILQADPPRNMRGAR
jgi:hypothetical protein